MTAKNPDWKHDAHKATDWQLYSDPNKLFVFKAWRTIQSSEWKLTEALERMYSSFG